MKCYAYVNSTITANECKHTAHDSNTEGDPLGAPASRIRECGKNFLRIGFRAQCQQGYHDAEEA